MKVKILSIVGLLLLCVSVGYAATGGMISGVVKGPDGAPFRAAFVRITNTKTKVTTSVLSDNQGKYWADNLTPGSYDVSATAIGFRGDPAKRSDVKIDVGQPVSANFDMKKGVVQWNQLTKYQGMELLPEGDGKRMYMGVCLNCHGLSKLSSRLDKDGWLGEIAYMKKVGVANIDPATADIVAGYLGTALGPNSGAPKSPADLPEYKNFKREHDYWSDEALNIEYVDYPLTENHSDRPGTGRPDKDGTVWVELQSGLGHLNPKTGEMQTWRLPESGPDKEYGIHELLVLDDSVWLTVTGQGSMGLTKFDKRTQKFTSYDDYCSPADCPKIKMDRRTNSGWGPGGEQGYAGPRKHTAIQDKNGNIWSTGRPLVMLDVETGKFTHFMDAPDTYGVAMNKERDTLWFAEFDSEAHQLIGKVDVNTGKVTKYHPPTVNSGPRRLKIDSQGNVWFGEFYGGNATRFDPKTETFTEFKMPGGFPSPYGFGIDHNDNIWYVSFNMDYTGKLNPKTGKFVEYPSPYVERGDRDLWEDGEGRMWYGAQSDRRVGYFYVRSGAAPTNTTTK